MKDLELMNELMGAISQTGEWERIEVTDPQVKEADKRHTAVLNKVRDLIPADVYAELEDATLSYAFAIKDSAILYGIRVADAIRAMAADPVALSQYVVDQMKSRRG